MNIHWYKRGFIFCPDGSNDLLYSHTHKPTPLQLDEDTLRIFFGARSRAGQTRTTYIDVSAHDPEIILDKKMPVVLDLGKTGAFDDCGANVSSVLDLGDRIYMYFIGWNPGTTVHTRNAIGVAVSEDRGNTFSRIYDGAILDRTKEEPYYTGAVDVIYTGERFEMWYTSGLDWQLVNGKPEINYHIKRAISDDGINWHRDNQLCLPDYAPGEVTARPSVIKTQDNYVMWFSKRKFNNFRSDPSSMYRAGYATSSDGIHWERDDSKAGILLGTADSWDSQAIAYPYVRKVNDKYLMLYNGNGFGQSGFGYMLGEAQ